MGVRKALFPLSLPQVEVSRLVTSTKRPKLRVTVRAPTLGSQGRERREAGRLGRIGML